MGEAPIVLKTELYLKISWHSILLRAVLEITAYNLLKLSKYFTGLWFSCFILSLSTFHIEFMPDTN